MGHIVNPDREYRLLQQKLDTFITGAPDSPALMQILRLLFSPEDAEFARRIPFQPTSLEALIQKLGIPEEELNGKLTDLASRGLVMDLEHKGQRYFLLSPVVIGFFEFTFMRARDNLPMEELARLFEQYMEEDDRFARSVFQGQTQLGRTLVHEEALPEEDHTEILSWERASQIIQTASSVGISICSCRHKQSHLGKACEKSQNTCLSLNFAADTLIRNGIARPISSSEAMSVLEESKISGLAQTGDNVQRKVTYICNCCGCCCGMVYAAKSFNIRNAIVTSNWIMEVDLSKCTGCGQCEKACPFGAIIMKQASEITKETKEENKKKKWAVRDEALCMGCGVCYSSCKFDALQMKPRPQRVVTPETIFDRTAAMAIERGKLADLLFNNHEKLSHRALGRIISVIEKSPPFKAMVAIKPLKSAFMRTLANGARKQLGALSEFLE